MKSQQKADGELLQVFGKVVAIVLLLTLLSVLGFRYFGSVSNISSQGLRVDHNRLLNVLGMVKAQWLAQGRPTEMKLTWASTGTEYAESYVKMSAGGWPLPNNRDASGCEQLWYQLLGKDTLSQQFVSEIDAKRDVCNYIANNSDRVGYQLTSGRVIFLTNDK